MKNLKPENYIRFFRIGNLYFKYIKGTELEKSNYTGAQIADWLEKHKFIERRKIQGRNPDGTWTNSLDVYVELTGKQPRRKEVIDLILKKEA